MKPNLLMRAWMMAHLYGAEYQAVVCLCGFSGEVAFRESLCPQYTSDRHDVKGLRTYYITSTCVDTNINRIACGHIGRDVAGTDGDLLHITITSNTQTWQEDDLAGNPQLVSLDFDMPSLVCLSANFLTRCVNLQRVNLTPLRAIEVLCDGFLSGCSNLESIDLTPLINLRKVGRYFLSSCTSMKSIDLTPLRAVEVLLDGFLCECSGLEEVDLSPLTCLANVSDGCLQNCASLKAIRLAHHPTSLLPSNLRELAVRD